MQNRPPETGNLIDNRGKQFPAHVCGRLKLRVGARTGGAQEIAAVGDFQIETNRRTLSDLGALAPDGLVIAARIERRAGFLRLAGEAHGDSLASAALRSMRFLQATNAQASKRPPNRIDFVTILGM